MRPLVRSSAIGAATVALAVGLAAAFAAAQRGHTRELPAFALWCVPLGLGIAAFARRPRFARLPTAGRAVTAAAVGLLAGVAMTLAGAFLMGGWMLAWDFPVFYCWATAGVAGALGAAVWTGSISARHVPVGLAATLLPLGALAWLGTRPTPAVLVVYRTVPGRDVAEEVYDSVLTRPHASDVGRDLRWDAGMYARTSTADGRTAALIGLRRAADRDSVRHALAGDRRVAAVIDTTLPR